LRRSLGQIDGERWEVHREESAWRLFSDEINKLIVK
jgi:hypothetical protein